MQGPWITTSLGYGRPVSRYTYDQYNNVTAYCDSQYVWTTGATTCAPGSGVTSYKWDYSDSANEPFGRLTDAYTPTGYHAFITYDASVQNGDNGLPSKVQGDPFTQFDGTTMQPQQTFTYDTYGNIATYSKGSGSWTLQHDSLNRLTSAKDPDGVISRTCYYDNGQTRAVQSAYQYSLDGSVTCGTHSVSYTYDADGNEISETHHFGQVASNNYPAGVTDKWYDGADRLVEVRMPYFNVGTTATNDYYPWAWTTRYIYDLTQNGTLGTAQFTHPNTSAVTLTGHGNLLKTQEYLSGEQRGWSAGSPPITGAFSGTWTDLKGYSYDGLDRTVFNLVPVPGTVAKTTMQYDASTATYGLLVSKCDGLSECSDYAYDTEGHQTAVNFVGVQAPTPDRTYTYDPDGRLATASSTQFGTEKYAYDANGSLIERDEPTGGGVTGAAAIKYTLYPNGMREALSIAGETSSVLNQTNALTYDYQNDGLPKTTAFNYQGAATTLSYTYTSAGRMLTRSENTPGSSSYTTQYGYDPTTGHVTSLAIPATTQTNPSYDGEDKLQVAATNTRGEVISQYGQTFSGANGFMIPTSGNPYSSAVTDFDALAGTSTGGNNVNCSDGGGSNLWSYDAIGRESSAEADYCLNGVTNIGTISKTFDAENHTLSAAYARFPIQPMGKLEISYTGAAHYQWGPEGHPVLMGSGSPVTYDTVHWDGNAVLFVTDSAGNLRDFKLGMDADYTPEDASYKGITFLDRDISGVIVSCHNSTGVGALVWATAKHSEGGCQNATGGMTAHPQYADILMNQSNTIPKALLGNGAIPWSPGRDGYTDGATTFQGARAYDPQLGNWTTPDASQGDASDPTTQKAYMWNGNNAVAYADPSGYAATLNPQMLAELGDFDAMADGAGCDGVSDPSGACHHAGEQISVPGTGQFNYNNSADAAKAAQNAYAGLTGSAEIGCAIYCKNGKCAFGPASVGVSNPDGSGHVDIDLTPYKLDKEVDIWHRHPPGTDTDFTTGHTSDSNGTYRQYSWLAPGFKVFTTIGVTGTNGQVHPQLYWQSYPGIVPNDYDSPPVLLP